MPESLILLQRVESDETFTEYTERVSGRRCGSDPGSVRLPLVAEQLPHGRTLSCSLLRSRSPTEPPRLARRLAATGTASGVGGKSTSGSPRPGASSIIGSAAFLLIV